MTTTTENVIGQVLQPVFNALPLEIAQRIAGLSAAEGLQNRVSELAAKANEGELTPAERAEYQALIDAGDILITLREIARKTVANSEL